MSLSIERGVLFIPPKLAAVPLVEKSDLDKRQSFSERRLPPCVILSAPGFPENALIFGGSRIAVDEESREHKVTGLQQRIPY